MELIEEKLAALLNDKDFDVIKLELKSQNIFNILGAARTEIRHSNFLAWLMQPDAGHGLGSTVLSRFIRDIFSDDKCPGKTLFDADLLNYEKVEVLREWKNIDLVILLDKDVIVIENKVDAVDSKNQLKRYKKIVEDEYPDRHKHYVYLTPHGSEPKDQDAAESYVCYSYAQFVQIVEKVVDVYGDNLPQKIKTYIGDYLSIVRREIMKEDEINELAVKMYKAHKEAFDFVFENMPDPATELYPLFVEAVKNRGWIIGSKNKGTVKFSTQKINEILPPGYGEWFSGGEMFLFEIDYYWTSKWAVFKTVIPPGNEDIRKVLNEFMTKVEGHKEPAGKKWYVHFAKKQAFKINEVIDEDQDTIRKIVDGILDGIMQDVERVEKAFVDNEALIRAACK